MLTRKAIFFFLFLSSPTMAAEFKDSYGVKWNITVPDGWRIINHPDSLKEGVQLIISSSPAATWDKPFPPEGEAIMSLGFYTNPGSTSNTAFSHLKDFKHSQKKMLGKHNATVADIDTQNVSKAATVNVVEVGNRIIVAKLWDNGRADSCMVLGQILDSLEVVK